MSEGGLFGSFLASKGGFCSDARRILCVFRIFWVKGGIFFFTKAVCAMGGWWGLFHRFIHE